MGYDEAFELDISDLVHHFQEKGLEVKNLLIQQKEQFPNRPVTLTFRTELHDATMTVKHKHIDTIIELIDGCLLGMGENSANTSDLVLTYMNAKTMMIIPFKNANILGFYYSWLIMKIAIPIWLSMTVRDSKTGGVTTYPGRYKEYVPHKKQSRRE